MTSVWKEWITVTSWHGIGDFSRATNLASRVIWFLIIISSAFMIFTEISMHMFTYMNNKDDLWVQTASYKRKPYLETPTVHICSSNKVSRKSLERLDLELDAASFITDLHMSLFSEGLARSAASGYVKDTHQQLLDSYKNYTIMNPNTTNWTVYDWAMQLSPDCESIITVVAGEWDNPCFKLNITKTMFSNNACFDIHIQGEIALAGEMKGLDVGMNSSVVDYAPILQMAYINHVLSLFIGFEKHDGPGVSPSAVIQPSSSMTIFVTAEESSGPEEEPLNFFDHSKPPCHWNASLHILDIEYSSDRCILDCWVLTTYKHCGCAIYISPLKPGYRHCLPLEALKCLQEEEKEDNTTDACSSSCILPPCVYTRANHQVTGVGHVVNVTNWIHTLDRLYKFKADESGVNDYAEVRMYYRSLVVKMVGYKRRVSVANLISNIGGQLGIWGGMSLITIIQAAFYASYGIYKVFKKCLMKAKLAGGKFMSNQSADTLQDENSSTFTSSSTIRYEDRHPVEKLEYKYFQ